jgi:hypothetical protein
MTAPRIASSTITALPPNSPSASTPAAPAEPFEQVLRRTIEPPTNPDDLDGDGVLSKAEILVRHLKDAAEQLAFELVLRRGEVDPTKVMDGMRRLQRLANALTERIVSNEPFDDEDVANIAMEAMSIIAEATARPGTRTARDWDKDPMLDGKVEWRHERRAFTEARGALAARLEARSSAAR